ncbi:MAG: hypothetical protein QOG87_3381 [Actinomycetota bacterium]
MLLDLLTVAILALVGVRLFSGARYALKPGVRAHVVAVVRGIRLRHLLPAPLVLVLVVTAAGLLVQIPVLDWGWWTEIGGEGNPVIGVTEQTTGSLLEWLVPAVFMVMLLPALPLFAEWEERRFRLGAEGWSTARRVWRGIQFGLFHAVIGIPIGVALALSIGGWYFTATYLRGWRAASAAERQDTAREAAVLESTRAHLAYNLEVLLLVVVAIVLGV